MPRRADDLYDSIASFRALHLAALEAVKGKRRKPGAATFMANLKGELLRLERELMGGTYCLGSYTTFMVKEPKERFISAAPFRDRVVHHALCAVVVALFERGFIDDSFANRLGKVRTARWRVTALPGSLPPRPALRHLPLLSLD